MSFEASKCGPLRLLLDLIDLKRAPPRKVIEINHLEDHIWTLAAFYDLTILLGKGNPLQED